MQRGGETRAAGAPERPRDRAPGPLQDLAHTLSAKGQNPPGMAEPGAPLLKPRSSPPPSPRGCYLTDRSSGESSPSPARPGAKRPRSWVRRPLGRRRPSQPGPRPPRRPEPGARNPEPRAQGEPASRQRRPGPPQPLAAPPHHAPPGPASCRPSLHPSSIHLLPQAPPASPARAAARTFPRGGPPHAPRPAAPDPTAPRSPPAPLLCLTCPRPRLTL